jgi:hypothetical protein
MNAANPSKTFRGRREPREEAGRGNDRLILKDERSTFFVSIF